MFRYEIAPLGRLTALLPPTALPPADGPLIALAASPEPLVLPARYDVLVNNKLRKVDIGLPGKGDSNSHGARPVQQIISMIKWIRTSRLPK